jgi:cell division protein FtsA
MSKKKFQTIFDCGASKVRAGILNKDNESETFFNESKFFIDHSNSEIEIQKIITSFEKNTNEYIDNINLMIDSPKMLSIGISISKKLDGSKLRQTNVQFLIQEAKQQILKYYANYKVAHIIINNYKIDNIDYSYLPDNIESHFISLDIIFICLPSDIVRYYKNIFSKSNILINQVVCSSYVKSINYKNNQNLTGHLSFIDIGFNKTSIISYFNSKTLFFEVLPIGGNNITKDISKILGIDLEQAEQLKLNFNQDYKSLSDNDTSAGDLEKVIFARTEEILELCIKSIKSNLFIPDEFKMVLTGEGSKILDNRYKNKISFSNNINFSEETLEDICQSGFKFGTGLNKQEVIVVPKKQIKQGFFEKLFHFFR